MNLQRVGTWIETAWARPPNQAILVKHVTWHATVTSARTGEVLPISYYVAVTLRPDEASPKLEVWKTGRAYQRLETWVEDATRGWAYLVPSSRAGLIDCALREVCDDHRDDASLDWDALLDEFAAAVRVALGQWEAVFAKATRLGYDPVAPPPHPDPAGWPIPIVPLIESL